MPTVVIADDSPTLRRIVSSVLGRAGYEVIQAQDGVQAVQAVFRTQPDAVVLDVAMPRVSGYVVARLLKDDWQTADIPLVVLTSQDAASDRYWAAHTGADRFLTKDFEAPELTSAVEEVIAASSRRGPRPDPLELSADDVMVRMCDLLDRKLFETSVAAEVTGLAATTHGFEERVAALLDVLGRVVDDDLAAVLLVEERSAYVGLHGETSPGHYEQFLSAAADAAAAAAGVDCPADGLQVRLADPDGRLGGDDDAPMATFLSMPLRGHGGRVIGVLALSSATPSAFGESALATLRLIDGPAAVVLDNARLAGVHAG